MVHDEAHDPVFWPTPEEKSEERNRRKTDAATAAIAGTATVGVVAPGVVAAKLKETAIMVGVATTTTAAEVAVVVDAGEARRVFVVAQDAAKGPIRVETTGATAASLGKALECGGGREDEWRGAARQPPPVRLRPRARTTAR